MQTFLPYPSFAESARCLDNKRLGKQRVECLQILNALANPAKGWQNHPAVKMWRGHTPSLVLYGCEVCLEWKARGFKDTCLEKISSFMAASRGTIPGWLGDEAFHASHRSNLLRKDAIHYGKFGWVESNDLPYIWPTN